MPTLNFRDKVLDMARPTGFNDDIAFAICEKISTTPRGLDFVCETTPEFPHAATVWRWLDQYPEFRESYRRARARQADLIFDECLAIADDASGDTKTVGSGENERDVFDSEFAARSKIRIDTRLRMAGKLNPKKYGDKQILVGGDPDEGDKPVQVQAEVTVKFVRPE